MDWIFEVGRFNYDRWKKGWGDLFASYELVHNVRKIRKIELSKEGDGAFAVIDIDTLWRNYNDDTDFRWLGRICKIYTKMKNDEWKMIFQTGVLDYSDDY